LIQCYFKIHGITSRYIYCNIEPEAILEIDDIDAYNKQEGLALSLEEVEYLDNLQQIKQKTYGF
jgi:phosphoribosylformylglycinamidine synthase